MSKTAWFVPALASILVCGGSVSAQDLVVHEWGTVTNVHGRDGIPAGGLNAIDASEVLPKFVHEWEPEHTRHDPAKKFAKGHGVPGRPDVTMRLETPVIYFHPPAGGFAQPFDVTVRFRGGLINEFYPGAEASAAVDQGRIADKMISRAIPAQWTGDVLNNYVVGKLEWKGVMLHDTVVAPLTSDPVWLAPREVQAASVFVPGVGEGERYLFYRGVAHLDALLQTKVDNGGVKLAAPALLTWLEAPTLTIAKVWLADIRVDGALAFREGAALTIQKDKPGAALGKLGRFAGADYTPDGVKGLRASLKRSLINQGLFADEAEAMLNTWKTSYFEKPGLRVFYLTPREWIDYFLPLEISVPARVNRVIVGRIEIAPVTPPVR
jgi:hypothetical protein